MVSEAPNTDDLPAVTVVEITEPTAANAGFELYATKAVQLQSMPLRARRVVIRLGSAAVVFQSTNLRIRTRTTIAPGLVDYVAFGPRTQGKVNGLPIRPGMMLSMKADVAATFVAEAGYESVAFLLREQDFREQLEVRQRDVEFHLPQGIEPPQVDPEKARALFVWGQRLQGLLRGTAFGDAPESPGRAGYSPRQSLNSALAVTTLPGSTIARLHRC
jgi:hypothetical protein